MLLSLGTAENSRRRRSRGARRLQPRLLRKRSRLPCVVLLAVVACWPGLSAAQPANRVYYAQPSQSEVQELPLHPSKGPSSTVVSGVSGVVDLATVGDYATGELYFVVGGSGLHAIPLSGGSDSQLWGPGGELSSIAVVESSLFGTRMGFVADADSASGPDAISMLDLDVQGPINPSTVHQTSAPVSAVAYSETYEGGAWVYWAGM